MNPVLLTLVVLLCNNSTHECAKLPHPIVYAPVSACQKMVTQFAARQAQTHPDWVVREARCLPVA
jgi:hypothetical protein